MAQSIVGNIADTPPVYFKSKTDPIYTPSDTVNQYLEHFNNFRKTAVQGQPSRWSAETMSNFVYAKITKYCTRMRSWGKTGQIPIYGTNDNEVKKHCHRDVE